MVRELRYSLLLRLNSLWPDTREYFYFLVEVVFDNSFLLIFFQFEFSFYFFILKDQLLNFYSFLPNKDLLNPYFVSLFAILHQFPPYFLTSSSFRVLQLSRIYVSLD